MIVPEPVTNFCPFIETFPLLLSPLKNGALFLSKKYMFPSLSAENVIVVTDELFRNSIVPSAGFILTPFAIIIF